MEHLHHKNDGRVNRAVFVNGNLVDRPVTANIKSGVVEYEPQPTRVRKNKDFIHTSKLYGVVTVEFLS